MTTVTRIDGAPGTGKTYTLRQRLERRKAGGLSADDVNWITFTRAGTEDAVETVADVFPELSEDGTGMGPGDVARTFHSLTLALLLRNGHLDFDDALEPDPVIVQGTYDEDEPNPFADFCHAHGLSYDPDASDTKKLLSGEKEQAAVGNKFFAINDFLNQTCKPPEKHWDAPVETPIPPSRTEELLEKWDEYKRLRYEHRLYEFADYVHLAYEENVVPDVDLLLIDEFQDFTPAEYRLYKTWRDSEAIDEIVLAGDPEQSIYSFRGGSPLYFQETDRDEDIDLNESYRCPAAVADAAVQILDAHSQTAPRGFSGRSADGRLRSRTIQTGQKLTDDVLTSARRVDESATRPRIMLLTRTNSQLRRVSKALRADGIPFDILGSRRSLWEYSDLADLLEFLNQFPDATGYDARLVKSVLSMLPDDEVRDLDVSAKLGQTIEASAVKDALYAFDTAEGIVPRLDLADWKEDALAAAVDAPADLSPADVQIGTIHTAKGLEASSVFLFAEATPRIAEQYERDEAAAAEEHRVWYVGTTRAAEELTIVEDFFNGPTAPPIEWLRLGGVIA
jgi:DNA helicase-2/ATP-dependent DNA helicase PcrA